MSGFFGIFRPQGGPVDLEAFEQMKTAMHRDGFDGMETHVEEKIAMGHLMLRVSPESEYDKQPLKSSCGNYILVGHFRLDYRDELGDKLGLTQSELEVTPDSQLAMLAYQKWKEKCVYHLEGDWAMGLFNFRDNSLILLKDDIGYSAIYFLEYKKSIIFSSDIDMFSRSSQFELTPDIKQLVKLSLPGFSVEEGSTLYKNLNHVRNSEQILFDANNDFVLIKGAKINLQNGKIRFRNLVDYFFEYKSLFSAAIKTRMRFIGEKGLYLSGGLDSTAVLYFMAKESLFFNGALVSFTSIPDKNFVEKKNWKEAFQEFDLVCELKSEKLNCSYHFLSFPESTIFEKQLSSRSTNGLNPIITNNTFWVEGILRELHKRKIKRVFNGQLGNFTLTWNSPQLNLALFLNLRWIELLKNLIALSRKNKISFYRLFKIEVLSYFFLVSKVIVVQYLGFSKNRFRKTSVFKDHFIDTKELRYPFKKNSFTPGLTFYFGPESMRIGVFKNIIKHIGMQWYLESHRNAIESVDPTADRRFVEFSFRLPSYLFYFKGQSKFIYMNVMNKLLPDSIIFSNKTFKQSIDIRKRIIQDPNIKSFIDEIKNQDYLKNIFEIDQVLLDYQLITDLEKTNIGLALINDFLKKISIIRFFCFKSDNFVILQYAGHE